jgi:hypothetical protein
VVSKKEGKEPMKTTIKTHRVSVCSGLRRGYTDSIYPIAYVEGVVQGFIDGHDVCVILTPIQIHYPRGDKLGVIVGFVNDPLNMRDNLYDLALELGELLKEALGQDIVFVIGDDYITALS